MKNWIGAVTLVLVMGFACDFVDNMPNNFDLAKIGLPAWTHVHFKEPFDIGHTAYTDGLGLRSYERVLVRDSLGATVADLGRFKKTGGFSIADARAIEFLEGLRPELRDKINWDKLSYYFKQNTGDFSWRVPLDKLYAHFEDDSMRSTYIRLPPKPEPSLWDFANTPRLDLTKSNYASVDCPLSPAIGDNAEFYRVGTWRVIDTQSFKTYEIDVRDDGRVMTFELN